MDPLMPPPVRRIVVDREAHVVVPDGRPSAPTRVAVAAAPAVRQAAARPAPSVVRERMRVESVWLAYGENWVVRDVTLPVRQGEVLALIGASGSGKTTLLRSLNRLTEITAGGARAGRITLDGEEIHELEVNDLRRRVSMVFQQPNPFPMSIYDNVAYALVEQRPPTRSQAQTDAATRAGGRATRFVAQACTTRSPATSTGRRCNCQAVSSSACASPARWPPSPRCCCWTSRALRSTRSPRRRSSELIVGLRDSVAIVIVTHNLQQAFRVADHVAFMHLGELVEYGSSEQVFDRPREQRTRDYISGAFG